MSTDYTIRLLPGMVLSVYDALLFSLNSNGFAPSPGEFRWPIPINGLNRLDWFFLSLILAMGEPMTEISGRIDMVRDFRGFMAHLTQSADFGTSLTTEVLNALHPSLSMTVSRRGHWKSQPGTAARVREWLTLPSAEDFDGASYPVKTSPQQYLSLQLPYVDQHNTVVQRKIRAFHSMGAFHLDDGRASLIPDLEKRNAWYNEAGPVFPRRFQMEASVPFRFTPEVGNREVPVHYSLKDIEQEFSVKIQGIRREPRFFTCVRDANGANLVPDPFLCPVDGKVSIFFEDAFLPGVFSGFPNPLVPKEFVFGQGSLKEQMLVAPGDVLVVGQIDRYLGVA